MEQDEYPLRLVPLNQSIATQSHGGVTYSTVEIPNLHSLQGEFNSNHSQIVSDNRDFQKECASCEYHAMKAEDGSDTLLLLEKNNKTI